MTPEDRLRDAAKAYTDPIQPAPDAWARVRERVDAKRRRRRVPAARVALAGFAAAIVIALVVTLVTVVRDDGGTGVTAGPSGERPEQIVAVTEDGRVVVLDASTGSERRQLATGADSSSTVTTAPDGRRIFFDRAVPAATECSSSREIMSVSLDGGEPELVVPAASEPTISPDGRLLAYLGHGGASGCNVPESLVVQPVDASAPEREWTLGDGFAESVDRLSWAPDSRHLAFGIVGSVFPEVIDTETAQAIDDARELEFEHNTGWFGYLGDTGDFLGTLVPDNYGVTDDTFRVVAIGDAGRVTRQLFSATGTISDPLVADASGRHVLLRTGPDGDSEALYRWSKGDAGLTKITDGAVVAAAWMSEAQPPAGAPAEIVAAKNDGRLVVMDAETGAEIRTLADGLSEGTTIAVTPDRKRVFFDRPSGPESDPPVEIVTVPTSGGEVTRLIGGAGQPAVSPDGRLLAFVRYLRSRPAALLVVEIPDTLEGWIPNVVADGELSGTSQTVVAPSWAPDSLHLVYTVVGTPEGSPPRVAEVAYGMRLDAAPPIPVPVASCAVTSYLGDTGLVAVAHGGDRAIAVDPASGQEVRELFRGPGLGCGNDRPLASDPSGAHLLYVTSGSPELYRWSEGDAQPAKIADGIVAAAWLAPPT